MPLILRPCRTDLSTHMTSRNVTSPTDHCSQVCCRPHQLVTMVPYLLQCDHKLRPVLITVECGDRLVQVLNPMVDLMHVNFHSAEAPELPLS